MQAPISIIIPVLNEAATIAQLLIHLSENASKKNIKEIIVVDGGSTDNTLTILSKFKEVILVKTSKGRAKQLNTGARIAKGNILYFLHADTFPPKKFDQKIIQAIKNHTAGCFRLKFKNPNHFLLKIAPWFTQFQSSLFRGGDQSLFISKINFEALKGFDERYFIFEDIEFINRIYRNFNFTIVNDFVISSERRFNKNGVWKLYFNFLMIHIKNWLGASPKELYQYYLKSIR